MEAKAAAHSEREVYLMGQGRVPMQKTGQNQPPCVARTPAESPGTLAYAPPLSSSLSAHPPSRPPLSACFHSSFVVASIRASVRSGSVTMRLRFLWIDYYEEASKAAGENCRQNQLCVPSLSDCLSSSVGNVALDAPWISRKLSEEDAVSVGDPSTLQQLCIRDVQERFLCTVLPLRIEASWKPFDTECAMRSPGSGPSSVMQNIDHRRIAMYPRLVFPLISAVKDCFELDLDLDCCGHLRSKSFPRLESMAVDTPRLNSILRILLLDLAEIASRGKGDENALEGHFRKDMRLCFEKQLFQPEGKYTTVSSLFQDYVDQKFKIVQPNHMFTLDMPTQSVGAADTIFPLAKCLKSKLLFLEVVTFDDVFQNPSRPSLQQDLHSMTAELYLRQEPLQLYDLGCFLEAELSQLATSIFALKFLVQFQSHSKLCLDLSFEAHQPLEKLFLQEDPGMHPASKNRVAVSLKRDEVRQCSLQVFELPAHLCEVKSSVASWGHQHFTQAINFTPQCVPTLNKLNSDYFKLFQALIVMPELALTDYVFGSLPVPSFLEIQKRCIATDIAMEALSLCKQFVAPAVNLIYLDWHLSQKKDCGKHSCFVLGSKINNVEWCRIVEYAIPHFENVNLKDTFNEVDTGQELKCTLERESRVLSPKRSCSFESRESVCPCPSPQQAGTFEQTHGAENPIPPNGVVKHVAGVPVDDSVTKPQFTNMFACNDLTFFLHARHGHVNAFSVSGNPGQQDISGEKQVPVGGNTTDFHEYNVQLSKPILQLMESLELDYSRNLEADTCLQVELQAHNFLNILCTETHARVTLLALIKKRASKQATPEEHQVLRGLIALYILQQTAHNLCMYGIRVGHLYMESWYLNLNFLQDLICFSYVELEEAYIQVEKGLLLDHPKLTYLESIIKRHTMRVLCPKVLVIAERRALFTLYKQMVVCNLKPYQFDREENLLHEGTPCDDPSVLKQAVESALLKCNCLMVPPEYLTASFPLEEFTCIVQYGDLSSNDGGNPILDLKRCIFEAHVLRIMIKQNASSISSSTVQGADANAPQCGAIPQEPTNKMLPLELASQLVQEDNQRESYVDVSPNLLHMEACSHGQEKPGIDGLQVKQIDELNDLHASGLSLENLVPKQPSSSKRCAMNIVVNINQSCGHLLSSRRSSYQRIIALEKDGLHVVERELLLPIDLIMSPTVCLIWYTQEKLLVNESTLSQGFPISCIEGITNSHMKAISFSFKSCIMVRA